MQPERSKIMKKNKKEFWFWWGQPIGVAIIMVITILTLMVFQSESFADLLEEHSSTRVEVECVNSE